MEAVLLLIWWARATAEDRAFAARNNLSKRFCAIQQRKNVCKSQQESRRLQLCMLAASDSSSWDALMERRSEGGHMMRQAHSRVNCAAAHGCCLRVALRARCVRRRQRGRGGNCRRLQDLRHFARGHRIFVVCNNNRTGL